MEQISIVPDAEPSIVPDNDRTSTFSPLKPALFARYGNLEALRYDYPLVLIKGEDDDPLVRPLSRIVDDALKAAAPRGIEGEELRHQVLRLEKRIRDYVANGVEETLSELWRICEAEIVKESGEAPFGTLDRNLDLARQKVKVDGKVIGCDGATPDKILGHAWKAMHKKRARIFRKKVDGLILKLTDILKSDHMKSDEAHGAGALASAMGTDSDSSIDFSALSGVLNRVRPQDRLPADRVMRIRHALHVLQTQAFYGPGRASYVEPEKAVCYSYVFKSCSAALDAYRERLPAIVEFTKALTIAEMEAENKYVPTLHDEIFEAFDESDLTDQQIELLPPAMVYLRDGVTESSEIARAFEALACGLPIKVLIQVDDVLGPTSPEPARNSFGAGTGRLASMAMGLNNAFVMQSTTAHLYRMREKLARGMDYAGPALFSIYSGATPSVPDVEPYILAAAATESRAFPSFTFDPSAGKDVAGRFDLTINPQPDMDWPRHSLDYEDALGGAQQEEVLFTFGDFAICDSRYQRFCHGVKREEWSSEMIAFSHWLSVPVESEAIQHPFVYGADSDNQLLRVIVDDKITTAARRCNDAWKRLQEMGGINNSHAIAALAAERRKREETLREIAALEPIRDNVIAESIMTPAAQAAQPVPDIISDSEPDSSVEADDMPWIETARCTTCNECRQINDALFGYDDNKQAFIADPDAGSYRQLVEAAESCQVSIIHPGLPRNPDEANLDELIERARPFN